MTKLVTLGIFVAVGLFVSCSPAPPPPVVSQVPINSSARAVPTSSWAPAARATIPMRLPVNAVFRASIDLSKLSSPEIAPLLAPIRGELEHFGINPSALSSAGIDESRPALFAVVPPSEELKKRVNAQRSLLETGSFKLTGLESLLRE